MNPDVRHEGLGRSHLCVLERWAVLERESQTVPAS
jgi:hypothetical protein